MDSQEPNPNQLDRLEQKIDELTANQEYMMKRLGWLVGFVKGALIVAALSLLANYLGWF